MKLKILLQLPFFSETKILKTLSFSLWAMALKINKNNQQYTVSVFVKFAYSMREPTLVRVILKHLEVHRP